MATWTSGDRKWFISPGYTSEMFWLTWSYSTSADVFTLHTHWPEHFDEGRSMLPDENKICLGPSWNMHKVYQCIRHFLLVYEGSGVVKKLDEQLDYDAFDLDHDDSTKD